MRDKSVTDKVLDALTRGALNTEALAERVGASNKTTSQALGKLLRQDMVLRLEDGTWMLVKPEDAIEQHLMEAVADGHAEVVREPGGENRYSLTPLGMQHVEDLLRNTPGGEALLAAVKQDMAR